MDQLIYNDLGLYFERLLERETGYYIDSISGKLKNATAHDPGSPWVHAASDANRNCKVINEFWRVSNIIPERCYDCWKVVVMPNTLVQLFKLSELQNDMVKEDPKCWCKCGVERRPFVPRLYGGYFYTDSQEAGLARYEQVRQNVDARISPAVNVVLKRACTEYELKANNSALWKMTKWERHMCKLFADNIEIKKEVDRQPDCLKIHVMKGWIEFACANGDQTYKFYNNGQPIYTPSVTYHKKTEE
jgi:hypothetical protein